MSDILYAGAHWIGPPHSENYFVGRIGYGFNDSGHQYTITAIGLHHTATTLQGAIDTFRAAPASGKQHSAHFIVDLDGTRYQMLDTDNTAFALGDEAGNCYTVNIEIVQTWDFNANVKTSDFTDAQYASVADICRIVAADNDFVVSAATIHGHNFWTQTTCPGDLDLARIITPQIGVADMDSTEHGWLADLRNVATNGLVGAGTKSYNTQQLDEILAAVKAGGGGGSVDLAPILAALADLKAHPAVVADPALLAAVQKIDAHFTGK